ncbi:hypothetical protein B6A10_07910 [Flavobacterium sp. L1I52]|uniref:DUF4957 domain-containing protein n=1 Tax=Flavobacterium pokkalii TaxID=1940408 RepID=A0ABR7UQB7_9FLAO|nr:DUF4957 domain-containing protein [Flavobacterium pokkalii]MBD0725100.1 hypothetical protein [Flavobacterium pokkalii]
MKNLNKNIYRIMLFFFGVLFLYSCSENEDMVKQTRLFRPVLNKPLISIDNTIIVNMAKMKSAIAYKVEISRDTFKTVIKTYEGSSNEVVFDNLVWNASYQVRAIAFASDEQYNSKISELGDIKTQRFPSIMAIPVRSDVIDTGAKVHWATVDSGAEVTDIKVFAFEDELLQTPLASYPTTDDEKLNGEKIIYGLTPGTKYQIAIYSGSTVRGWEVYTTKDPLPTGPDVIDLRGTNDPSLLISTLASAPEASTIILDGNYTYNATGFSFSKSVTIKSGYSFVPGGAKIAVSSQFKFVENSNITSVVFDGVSLYQPLSPGTNPSGYLFSPDKSYTINELKFDNCRIYDFRGLMRSRSGTTGLLNNFIINNSIVTNIRDYSVLMNESTSGFNFGNILFKNSTLYKCQKFLVNKATTPVTSIKIEDCTFSEVVAAGANLFEFASNSTDGVFFTNTIISRGWDLSNTQVYAFNFVKSGTMAETSFIFTNTYDTSDTAYTVGPPSPINFRYSGTSTSLWEDYANGDFTFIDSGFGGLRDCGDPRWRL